MPKIDLKNLTQLQLIDLSREITEELYCYENRDKIKVFQLNIFGENSYYKTADELKDSLLEYIEDYDFEEMIGTGKGIEMSVNYMDEANFNTWVNGV